MAKNKGKRKPKEVEKQDVQTTSRGRQVKRIKYTEPNYLDDSSSEENIVYHKKGGKNKKEESDDEFEVKECDKKSESEDESLSSSGSDLVEESEIESNKPKKKKKAIKPKIHVYDNQTIASNAASSSSLIPSGVNQSAKKQNKNPFSLIDEDVEEIDGQKIPDFARKEFIRDKNLRRPDDPDYDPSTIDIPDKLYEQLTPGMKQYWNIK